MQCYSELIPPSGVTHALQLPFTSTETNNLIVAKTSVLQIFSQKQVNGGQDTKLVLVAEEHLSGTITSLGRVKILESSSGGEALLISFRDAKLSLLEWDADHHCISTTSIHYYENDDLLRCPWTPDLQDCPSRLTIDPSSRCAAFNFGIGNLAIIPFHQSGDDLVMDDYDDFDNGLSNGAASKQTNGDARQSGPYSSSFVLPLTSLESSLLHPIDLAFLHEYREPTFGVLYSSAAKSENLLYERKDVVNFAIYALDLDQKASTSLMSVHRLPNDLNSLIPLPLPVGGTLLVGSNEIIHVDQGGKSTAIGVNEFAQQLSAYSMADRSDYAMRLEGCQIQQVGNAAGDMLVVLASGEAAILQFRLDGRSVSSISLEKISREYTRGIIGGRVSCMTPFGLGRLFIGSEEADSVLVGTTKKISQMKRQPSRANGLSQSKSNGVEDGSSDEEEDIEDEDDDDDDDLYGDASAVNSHINAVGAFQGSNLREMDRLICIAPIRDMAFGRVPKRKRDDEQGGDDTSNKCLELAIATGSGQTGSLSFLSREISPQIVHHIAINDVTGVWSFPVKRLKKESQRHQNVFHDHVILSKIKDSSAGESSLFTLSSGKLVPKEGTEFDSSAGATIEVGSLRGGNHTVQVLENEIRVYDFDFGLAQIWPINDEDSESDAKAVKACILDPVVLILKDDSSLLFLKADKSGELDELELPESLAAGRYISMTLYNDADDFFDTKRFYKQRPAGISGNLLLGLLGVDGKLSILSLPNISIEVFSFEGLSFMPTLLASDTVIPKHWRHKDSVVELILADIGDRDHRSPYLIVKNEASDLAIYAPFAVPGSVGSFRFRKVATKIAEASPDVDQDSGEVPRPQDRASLRAIRQVGDSTLVFSIGPSPAMVVKGASASPQIHSIRSSAVRALSGYHEANCTQGFIFVDEDGKLLKARLPTQAILTQSDWSIRRMSLGHEITCVAYHQRTHSYVVSTNEPHDFRLPRDDEWHSEWQDEDTTFPPRIAQSSLKLINPESQRVISDYKFDAAERVTCIKSVSLEVSETSHEIKEMLVVGTATVKGEAITSRGNIYLFDVVDVVPEPGDPDTDLRLKLICNEDVKGAVTAVTGIGSQGFFLAAQGQKCMVRGLKEDMTILPVAFMDMRYYVKVAKELAGSGMTILGDGFSGLWLMGYSEEPYKMQLLGRDIQDVEVQAAEFLPDGKQLYIISSDGDGQLQILQYDPENPKTERGMKLLQRSTFNTGSLPTAMTLLPRTPVSTDVAGISPSSDMAIDLNYARYQIMVTTQEGGLALITPLSDQTYRRLSTLQNILSTNLEHPCGLNPRAYRAVETDGVGGLGMIDGNLVCRWKDQSSQHKSSMADKVGGTVWDIRADLEGIGGAGLGFL